MIRFHRPPPKAVALAAITVGELLALALWFAASAVAPQLHGAWDLTGGQVGWLTASVQLGFVVGAYAAAATDRPSSARKRSTSRSFVTTCSGECAFPFNGHPSC